jgi:hypothetical protein
MVDGCHDGRCHCRVVIRFPVVAILLIDMVVPVGRWWCYLMVLRDGVT